MLRARAGDLFSPVLDGANKLAPQMATRGPNVSAFFSSPGTNWCEFLVDPRYTICLLR